MIWKASYCESVKVKCPICEGEHFDKIDNMVEDNICNRINKDFILSTYLCGGCGFILRFNYPLNLEKEEE